MSTSSIHIERITREEWITTWVSSAYATFFEHPDWFDCWKIMYPHSENPFAVKIRLDNQKSVVIPCFKRKMTKGLLSRYECSPGGLYSGPIGLSGSLHRDQMQELLLILNVELRDFSFRMNPFVTTEGFFDTDTVLFTQVTDLGDKPTLATKLQQSGVAYDARSAHRKGLRLQLSGKDDLQSYLNVYDSCRLRWQKQTSIYPVEFFERLILSKHCDFWRLLYQNEYIGGGIILKGPNHAASWLTIVDPESTSLRPYEFLYQKLLNHYADSGYRWFDFNPSSGLQGVVRFKEKFGTRRMAFHQFERKGAMSSIIAAIRGDRS